MTQAEVHALIADVLGIDTGRVDPDLSYAAIPEWDSIHHVEIMLALENRLGVEVGPEDMTELTSVSAIEAFASGQGVAADDAKASEPSSGTERGAA